MAMELRTESPPSSTEPKKQSDLATLLSFWKLLLILPLLVAITTYSYFVTRPKIYEAQVGIVGQATLEMAPRPELNLPRLEIEEVSRRINVLASLVNSPEIAAAALEKFGSRLKSDVEWTPIAILKKVKPLTQSDSDLMFIHVLDEDAMVAADMANFWSEELLRRWNKMDGRKGELDKLREQIGDDEKTGAWAEYEKAHKDYIIFLEKSNLGDLEREIARSKRERDALQRIYESQMDSVTARRDAMITQLKGLYTERDSLQQTVGKAEALQELVGETGVVDSGSRLALVLLKADALGSSKALTFKLDVEGTDSAAVNAVPFMKEVESFIKAIAMHVEEVKKKIITLPKEVLKLENSTEGSPELLLLKKKIDALETDRNKLEADLEKMKRARRVREFAAQRAEKRYEMLKQKEGEVRMARLPMGLSAWIALPAFPPIDPVYPRPVLFAGLAFLAGIVIAVVFAMIFSEFRKSRAAA